MATVTLGPLEVKGTISGNSPMVLSLPEAASQTFRIGEVLTLDSSGFVTIGTTDEDRILGVATKAGMNLATNGLKDTEVYIASEGNIFVGNLFHTAAGNAGAASSRVDVGRGYGLTTLNSNWHVDKSKLGASRRVLVLQLDPRDAIGDIQARVHFVFLASNRALAYTS